MRGRFVYACAVCCGAHGVCNVESELAFGVVLVLAG